MNQQPLAILVAMPEEARPIARQLNLHRRKPCGGVTFQGEIAGRPILLIRSGMGTKRAAAACRALLATTTPRLIIAAGLGGGVRHGLAVGDVVIGDRLLSLTGSTLGPPISLEENPVIQLVHTRNRERAFTLARGSIITTREIVSKQLVSRLLPADCSNPVLDMETSAVAELCRQAGIPFLAVRAISDGADEELAFSLADLTDRDLNIRFGKVAMAILHHPGIMPQLLRLARNSRHAARNLALVLEWICALA